MNLLVAKCFLIKKPLSTKYVLLLYGRPKQLDHSLQSYDVFQINEFFNSSGQLLKQCTANSQIEVSNCQNKVNFTTNSFRNNAICYIYVQGYTIRNEIEISIYTYVLILYHWRFDVDFTKLSNLISPQESNTLLFPFTSASEYLFAQGHI